MTHQSPSRTKVRSASSATLLFAVDDRLRGQLAGAPIAVAQSVCASVMDELSALGITSLRRRRRGPADVTTMRGAGLAPMLGCRGRALSVGTPTRAVVIHFHGGGLRTDVSFTRTTY